MSGTFTTSTARNIFFGGTIFFALVFLALTYQNEQIIPQRDQHQQLAANPDIAAGKKLWETHQCIGCHTLLGEGAYFAPELGNVVKRYGVDGVKAFIKGRPVNGVPGRRSMPQFNMTDEELDDVAAFLDYVSKIDTANWPPNIQG